MGTFAGPLAASTVLRSVSVRSRTTTSASSCLAPSRDTVKSTPSASRQRTSSCAGSPLATSATSGRPLGLRCVPWTLVSSLTTRSCPLPSCGARRSCGSTVPSSGTSNRRPRTSIRCLASSVRLATRRAAARTAPDDTPANTPSRRSRSAVMTKLSSPPIIMRASSRLRSRMGGTNPSSRLRKPWMRSSGSGAAAMTSTAGLNSLSRRPVPMSVPPVPRPATKWVTSGRSRIISGPVVS